MDVSEILKLLATLSIGLDNPDDSDIVVWMRYINLCYFELLQATLSESPTVVKLHEKLDCTNGILAPTSQSIFIPKMVYNIASNTPLNKSLEEDVLNIDPSLTKTGTPQQWYYANGNINIYPITTNAVNAGGGFGIWYIAEPNLLKSISLSSDILIPKVYQQLLADGASYYIFQSETGFKDQNKIDRAQTRWEDGKKKLFSYMKNISGKNILSTFRAV